MPHLSIIQELWLPVLSRKPACLYPSGSIGYPTLPACPGSHSACFPQDEKERIEALGGFVSHMDCWRVNGTLAVSRAIGKGKG